MMINIDATTANFILNNKVFALTELFFDIRQLWTPAPKQRLEVIKKMNSNFYLLLETFYKENTGLSQKVEIAKDMLPIIFDK